MNYTTFSILEAAQIEMAKEFITKIKQMDQELACTRLRYILNCNISNESFIAIAAQFNSLVGHETSAD